MNIAFKLVWCAARGGWSVASEFAKGNGKGKSRLVSKLKVFGLAASLMPSAVLANINNDTDINKVGDNSSALEEVITDSSSTENITINNTAELSTKGDNSSGIFVSTKGSGDVSVTHSGTILTEGINSHGIYVESNSASVGQKIDVNLEGAVINNKGLSDNLSILNGSAVHVVQNNTQGGDIDLTVKDTEITGDYIVKNYGVKGNGAIYTESNSQSANISLSMENTNITTNGGGDELSGITFKNTADNASGDINITTKNGSINIIDYSSGYRVSGISASLTGEGTSGNINITNDGTNIHLKGYTDNEDEDMGTAAISAIIGSSSATGNITVKNSGNLTMESSNSSTPRHAIDITNQGNGSVYIENSGNLSASHGYGIGFNTKYLDNQVGNSEIIVKNTGNIFDSYGGIALGNSNSNVANVRLENYGDVYRVREGVYAGASTGATNVFLENNGSIQSMYTGLSIYSNLGDSTLVNTGDITVDNLNGFDQYRTTHAIKASIDNSDSSGKISVSNSGKLTTFIEQSSALTSSHKGLGDNIVNNTGFIQTAGDKAHAIYGLIDNVTSTGKLSITNSGSLETKGKEAKGIYSEHKGIGDNFVSNSGTISTTEELAHGINAYNSNSASSGTIAIINNGDIHTIANSTDGIRAYNSGEKGNIVIQSTAGKIETNGGFSHGISAFNKGAGEGSVSIENASEIITTGGRILPTDSQGAMGIYVEQHHSGDVNVINKGKLSTSDQAIRVYSKGGNSIVTNYADINTKNYNQENIHNHGIYTSLHGSDQTAAINHLAGTITVEGMPRKTGNSIGIALTSLNDAEGVINVASGAAIDAAKGMSGIQFVFTDTGKGEINLASGSIVKGGADAGINLKGGNHIVNIGGTLTSTNDRAFKIEKMESVKINNTGSIQGFIQTNSAAGTVDFDNQGTFLVRQLADSTYSVNSTSYGIDTKKVAISNFNDGTINNTGTIELMAVNGVANNDTTGEYTPTGALSSAEEGIQHGQLLGVKDFNHSGVLDIRGSGLSGNVFVITGDKTTAGNNGNGNFTTNGGVLKVATTLNEGGADSRSDMLVADNIIKGTDSTKVAISIAQASTGGKTVDDGIQIIKTLGTQDKTAFTLAGPVTFGEYEYLLFGENANGDADGFYLRNFLKDTDTKVYLPNPNIGGYLGNQYAAANMFNQNILDRRDNARAPDETVWARVQYNHMNTEQLKGTQKLKVDTSLVQIGADLYRDEQEGKVAGVFFGYGDSDVKNRSKLTDSEVKGSVKGVQLGGYYSWMAQDDNKGAFVDVWGHYAHFSNELSGAAQANSSKKYKGNGLALSIEGGYGFEVGRTEYNTWILEPHAQATYNYLKMDDFTDKNETRFKNNKSNGFTTRVGARFYGYKENQVGVLPFVELNWLHNGVDNGVYVNNTRKDSKIGRNVGELKLGAKGNITEYSSISAHIGVQQGSDKFRNSLGQLVFNYNF